MAKPKAETTDQSSPADDNVYRELEQAKLRIEALEGELRVSNANLEAVTKERAAMWRDYCRQREALLRAFPDIPDPDTRSAVEAAAKAPPSH